jgi:2,4-dienoyl-CoA reductase-like NADH-dependent reductase (Old Yellow Enzyme family)/pyruvate/2-oxoglutarate dehydrogenase complex dihydrolipoamide dehydrogenase (E3) component
MLEDLRPLFEPITVGSVKLKNRTVMAPMGSGLCAADGSVSQRLIDYYVERAKGQVGLIITEAANVDSPESGLGLGPTLSADHDAYIPGLRKLADAIHNNGAKVIMQLLHTGPLRMVGVSSVQPVAASAIPSRLLPKVPPRELSTEEVEELIEKHAQAARRIQQAGFDGVEIGAGQGYLIGTFLSPLTNKRTDRFGGGTPEARATFLLEIIRRIKERVGGNGFVIGCKPSVEQGVPRGITLEDTKRIAPLLVESGVNMFNAWGWWHEAPGHSTIAAAPRGIFVYCAEALKEVVSVPVGAVGRINDPKLAAQIIAEKRADLVIMGRALLADPHFPNKASEGDLDNIRLCITCNNCLDEEFSALLTGAELHNPHPPICSVNAEIGMEGEQKMQPGKASKKVLVIGGGPAGMEAARVASLRGHKVTLWEAKDKLGGALIPAAVPPHKEDINNILNYLTYQMKKLKVRVELDKESTPEAILKEEADEVIIATGASHIILKIPGVKRKNVVTAIEVLTGRKEVGEKVVIIGGGMVGCETAEFLASKGKKVTIVELLPRIARDVGITNRRAMRERIQEAGINVLVSAKTTEISETGITVEAGGETQRIEADTVVISVGLKPNNSLVESLAGKVPGLHIIGECREAGKILGAIHDAWQVACEI